MERGKSCCRMIFSFVDDFREAANAYNKETPAEISNITIGQMRVLKEIAMFTEEEKYKDGVMLKTLAGKVGLTPGATSIIVDSLVKSNMLDRTPSERDRRAVRISLSETGSERVNRYTDFFFNTMDSILKDVSNEDYAAFSKVLKIVNDNLKKKVLQDNKQ